MWNLSPVSSKSSELWQFFVYQGDLNFAKFLADFSNIPINKCYIASFGQKWLLPWFLRGNSEPPPHGSHRIRYPMGGMVKLYKILKFKKIKYIQFSSFWPVGSSIWNYLHISTDKPKFINLWVLSSTVRVWENKVPLFFPFFAHKPRFYHILVLKSRIGKTWFFSQNCFFFTFFCNTAPTETPHDL